MPIDIVRWLEAQDDELVLYDADAEALPSPPPDLGRPRSGSLRETACPGPEAWQRLHPAEDVSSAFTRAWPHPTEEDLQSEAFARVWECIKGWDVNVSDVYAGYCGATGNHVRAILDALGALVNREQRHA